MVKTSSDGGRAWSTARRLADGILGPIKNKPVRLRSGLLLSGSSTEHDGWVVHMETARDPQKSWSKSSPLNDKDEFGAIQPTILPWSERRIQILCRSRQGRVTQCWSEDGGKTWGKMTATEIVNPNAGIDAVMLKDGRALLVYNDTPRGRTPLSVAVSRDGIRWTKVMDLVTEPGEYSYPAVIQSPDGRVHITYTWRRNKIRHEVLEPGTME
jgi:predicted neuraminidase